MKNTEIELVSTGLYVITNCNCWFGKWSDSEPMNYDEAMELFKQIEKQARRGLRPFPELIEIMEEL